MIPHRIDRHQDKTRRALPPSRAVNGVERAVEQAIEDIVEIQDVYREENDALEAADTGRFLALQDKKLKVARQYQNSIEQLLYRREEVKAVAPGLSERLHKMQADFSAMVERNKEALERMQRCTARLSEIIRESAKEAATQGRTVGYGETGQIMEPARRPISMGISETA